MPIALFSRARYSGFPSRAALVALHLLLLPSQVLPADQTPAPSLSAERLMAKSWQSTLVPGSISKATFVLERPGGRKMVRRAQSSTKLNEDKVSNRRITFFEYPADARGIATLLIEHHQADDELWLYVPAAGRVRRIVPGSKKSSFMGTDLSYGDVLGHRVDAWVHQLHGEGAVQDRPCWVVDSHPRTDAVREEAGYSKRRTWVDKSTYVALKTEFWDLQGKPLKTVVNRTIEPVAGHPSLFVAREIHAENLQNGHTTTITIEELTVTTNIPDDRFAPRALEEAGAL